MPAFVDKILRAGEGRILRELGKISDSVNAQESRFVAMSDEELRGQTAIFQERYSKGETLDDLLPEAFAAVREAAKRTLGQRHYDVQMIGGITLHRGRIAEMRTGEGKTLVATLPAYLNALSGKGVHVITVNDYLAKRDSSIMGKVYGFLGLSTGHDRLRQRRRRLSAGAGPPPAPRASYAVHLQRVLLFGAGLSAFLHTDRPSIGNKRPPSHSV